MEPPVDARLQSMIRAVREVIAPALDESDGLARAQADLLLAHLETVRRQVDHLHRYHQLEYRSSRRLARSMVDAAVGGPRTIAAVDRLQTLLGDDVDSGDTQPAELRTATEQLDAAGEELVRATATDGEPAARAAVSSLAISEGRVSALRQLAWCDPTADLEAMLTSWKREVSG